MSKYYLLCNIRNAFLPSPPPLFSPSSSSQSRNSKWEEMWEPRSFSLCLRSFFAVGAKSFFSSFSCSYETDNARWKEGRRRKKVSLCRHKTRFREGEEEEALVFAEGKTAAAKSPYYRSSQYTGPAHHLRLAPSFVTAFSPELQHHKLESK